MEEHETDRRSAYSAPLRDALVAGSIVCIATALTAAARGARDSGSAVAPINATSHVVWGEQAADVERADLKHTALGFVINHGASVLWAGVYERLFGRHAARGHVGLALLGGGAVAALAYLVDYHVVGKRLTPGWEERVSNRSLASIYAALAVALPLRALFARRR